MGTLQGSALVEVDVSKFMGSESFSGRARKLERSSVVTAPSVDRTNDLVRRKELAFWSKMSESEFSGHQSIHNAEDASEDHSFRSINTKLPLTLGLEATQSYRNFGKVGRNSNSNSNSKRSRIVHMDVSANKIVEDGKGFSTEVSANTNCKNGERTQVVKQRQNSSGKRSDRRNGKVTKSNFSIKSLIGFGSAAGGRNFLGMYGLKSDVTDVAKDVNDLPLRELLDGSYKCAPSPKDKGNKASSSNDSLMQLVRDANSMLRLQKSVQTQNYSCVDSSVSCVHAYTGPSSESRDDGDKEETRIDNPSSLNQVQEHCCKVQTVATKLHAPSYTPTDVLERLALAPSKDLDSFLMDAVKPASSRNCSDLRLSKPSSQRNGLPPFPWSHTYSGHPKTVPDSAKLSTSKTVCQGRWVKVENTLTPLKGSTGFLVELQSVTDNHKLVPTGVQVSENVNASTNSDTLTMCERISSSIGAISTSEVPPADSPRILVAAATLCEIATYSLRQNTEETVKLLKRPCQKVMKACKLTEKSEKQFIAPKPVVGSNNLVEIADGILPSKKLRLSVNFRKPERKGPVPCSAQSIRSSPVKSFRDSEGFSTSFVNKPCMIPPYTRVMDKACISEQKLRKVANGVEPRR